MTFDEFCIRVKEEIGSYVLGAENVMLQDVPKNNGLIYKGLIIVDPILNISPTIYLNSYYDKYMEGELFSDVMFDIAETYEKNKPIEDFDISVVKEWEKAKDNIICKLINYDLNKEVLDNIPHKRVEDLAIVYMISVNKFMGEYATVLIRDELLALYDKSIDELDTIAKENIKKICPPILEDMLSILGAYAGTQIPLELDRRMYILSNEQKTYGAIHVLDPEVMDEIGKIYGDKCMVIPSSVHEVLLLPYNEEEYQDVEMLIEEVNNTQLTRDEILSNKPYVLDIKNHLLLHVEFDVDIQQQEEYQMQQKENEEETESEDNITEEELQEREAVVKRYEEKYRKKESSPKL